MVYRLDSTLFQSSFVYLSTQPHNQAFHFQTSAFSPDSAGAQSVLQSGSRTTMELTRNADSWAQAFSMIQVYVYWSLKTIALLLCGHTGEISFSN